MAKLHADLDLEDGICVKDAWTVLDDITVIKNDLLPQKELLMDDKNAGLVMHYKFTENYTELGEKLFEEMNEYVGEIIMSRVSFKIHIKEAAQ